MKPLFPFSLNKKTVLIFLLVPLCLACIKYLGDIHFTVSFLEAAGLQGLSATLHAWVFESGDPELARLSFWVNVLSVFYFIVPSFVILFYFKEKLQTHGLQLKINRKDFIIYLLLFAFMVPLVYFFSTTESFKAKYPFYSPGNGQYPNLLSWEILYLLQFFALEFFFRGFMVHGLKKEFGIYSVFIMTIPYCMIHFGKPFPETISSIGAGLVLGYMSFKSGSIIPGTILHFMVGLGMDMAALYQKGYFGE